MSCPAVAPVSSSAVVQELFHPTAVTADRDRTAAWLGRVMGLPSMMQREFGADPRRPIGADFPADYVLLSWVSDLWCYVADRARLGRAAPAGRGGAAADPWGPGLVELAWKVRDAATLVERFTRAGARLLDLSGDVVTSVDAMAHPISPDTHFLWSDPAQTGLSFELVGWPVSRPGYAAGWKHPPPGPEDPLGLRPPARGDGGALNPLGLTRSLWHTVVTEDLDRARWVLVDLLGGQHLPAPAAAGAGPALVVRLGGATVRYVRPEAVAPAPVTARPSLFGRAQSDAYHAIALGVRDLAAATAHLRRCDVRYAATRSGVATVGEDGLGVVWELVQDRE